METKKIILLSFIVAAMFGSMIHIVVKSNKVQEQPDLYEATMLTDSSFHVNLSDQSCMLVEIANGTMTIHTNNTDMVGYDKTANKVFVFYHDMQHSFTIREYYIDSLLGVVPDTTIFDNH